MDNNANQNKGNVIWLPLLLAIVVIGSVLIGVTIGQRASFKTTIVQTAPSDKKARTSVDEILRFIEEQYVDTLDQKKLRKAVIQAAIDQLDPHTYFIDKEEIAEIREKMDGELEGIGIEFMMFDDTITVLGLIEGGAAKEAGLEVGDRIVLVNDSVMAGVQMSSDRIRDLIKGPENTTVEIGIKRHGYDSLLDFTLTRRSISINSVPAAFEMDNGAIYLMIQRFTSHTHKDFVKALDQLGKGKEKIDLVLDLRHNPGGYLREAVMILSQLFPDNDKLMVYTEGANSRKNEYRTKGKPTVPIDRLVVLVDEGSASASEIIAGAVQDWERGVIIGRRTYGKGLVQEQFGLSDGSALRLTTARYYTPLGRLIQKDYANTSEYKNEVHRRLESGELFYADSMPILDNTPYETSSGRVLYSGNGVMPDIFIPFDSIHLYSCTDKLYSLYHSYAVDYMLEHPKDFNTVEELKGHFAENDQIFSDFRAELKQQDCFTDKLLEERKEDFDESLLAFLGNAYLDKAAFFQLMYEADPAVEKAAEVISSERESYIADK